MPLSPIPEILEELRAGKVIVLVDDEDRENEGDFVCAAEKVTVEIINFMTRVGAGYLCVSMTGADCDRLDLVPQAAVNTSVRGTPLTISIDGHPRHGVTTGISAYDRVKTIELMLDPNSRPDDFVRPGHINPLRARDGGVMVRTGQTEGAVDLARLADLHPSAVLIEVVREDGRMARRPDLEIICEKHGLKMCSVEQIIEYRVARERLVHRMDPVEGAAVATPQGPFNLIAYQSTIDPLPHLAFAIGGVGDLDPDGRPIPIDDPVLVRVHRRDLLGDIFNEGDNPSGRELRASLRMIQEEGCGVLVYLRPEGVGEGLRDRLLKIRRPASDDVNAPDLTRTEGIASRAQSLENRDLGIGGQILHDLGLARLRVLTNHPRKLTGLAGFGVEVVENVPIDWDPAKDC
ncbi:MAG: 3,4-dihydroxy-2-butanone-4-phosphate synthase [Phycisphaerales bacterium]|nr:MAG: 3,4-dihydroxy-2-butanone-4-phosphate synthase [Phycisphaerales bacterium]